MCKILFKYVHIKPEKREAFQHFSLFYFFSKIDCEQSHGRKTRIIFLPFHIHCHSHSYERRARMCKNKKNVK